MSENRTRVDSHLQNIKREVEAALQVPQDTGDVAALRAEAIKLRGILRGVHAQAQALQSARFGGKEAALEEAERKLIVGTVNYGADTQTIIGEDVNIKIPDIFE
jgi:hypothetical protein